MKNTKGNASAARQNGVNHSTEQDATSENTGIRSGSIRRRVNINQEDYPMENANFGLSLSGEILIDRMMERYRLKEEGKLTDENDSLKRPYPRILEDL